MRTFGTTNHDLDFTIAEGSDGLRQRIEQKLRFWFGEWFLDNSQGTPYIAEVLGHQISESLAQQAINSQILRLPEVTAIVESEFVVNPATRTASYQATVRTTYGDISTDEITLADIPELSSFAFLPPTGNDFWSASDFNLWQAGKAEGYWDSE